MPQKTTAAVGKRAPTELAGLSSVDPVSEGPRRPVVETGTTTDRDDGLFIKGHVGGVSVTFLVDTGTNITIMKPSVLQQIPRNARPSLQDPQTSMIMADGSSLPFLGRTAVELKTGPLTVVHDIWVADIDLDAKLGMNFLHKRGCELKLSSGRYHLSFPRGRIPCQDRRSSPVCRMVAVNQWSYQPDRKLWCLPSWWIPLAKRLVG